jgi:hypothetical protein
MPKISRPRTLRVAEMGLSVRTSVKIAILDREKEFGTSSALSSSEIFFPTQTDGMYPSDPFPGTDPILY